DIDRFKDVNDTMGHAAGDELLRQVADRLRGGARSHDVVARLAGDEFVVLLTDLPRSGAVDVAEPFALGGSQFSTSASIGVAVYPEHASDARSLLKAADTSMYASKRAGAGGV